VGLPRRLRTLKTVAVLLWAAGLFAFPFAPLSGSPALIAKAAPLRVMALGDSITAGVGAFGSAAADGGYRGPLGRSLRSSGYQATFVGTRSDYSGAIADRAHEGWPGYVVRSFPSDPGPGQLYGALVRKAMQENDPDLVLLMAGTNDLLRDEAQAAGYTLPNILHSMDLLLGQIVNAKPNVFVIVAPVVASPKVGVCAQRDFAGIAGPAKCGPADAGLKELVDAYARHGYRVSFAPAMATAVPRDTTHFPDGIHPCGAGGYAAIADVWLHAIEAITEPTKATVAREHAALIR
jgi:lysophospholipase L1-like esterase